MDFEKAIDLLKNTVKYSAVKNQKHLDFTLVSADEHELYQKALYVVNKAVEDSQITKQELMQKLNLS
ncbi:MAG: hypothetical protein OEY33_05635 [Bdellovibrionales bacterium]|nr:hypothetical protein [Bdellovibrionales bacterium]